MVRLASFHPYCERMTGEQLDVFLSCTARVTHQRGHGTGFFVAPELVLTCDHVLQGWSEGEPLVVRWKGSDHKAAIKQRNSETDLAILVLVESIPDQPCVFLSTDSLRLHEEAYAYGYPENFRGDSVTVEYEGSSETEEGQRLDKFKQGQARPGLSGAPLLSLTTGRVCGVVSVSREGIRTGGAQGTELLAQAVDAYHSALEVYTREVFPSYYELVRKNLDKAATLLAQAKPDVQ
jgi:hypothetical protein